MNKVYQVVWNASLNQWVVASELVSSKRGSKASKVSKIAQFVGVLVLTMVGSSPAWAACNESNLSGIMVSCNGSDAAVGNKTYNDEASVTYYANNWILGTAGGTTPSFLYLSSTNTSINGGSVSFIGDNVQVVNGRADQGGVIHLAVDNTIDSKGANAAISIRNSNVESVIAGKLALAVHAISKGNGTILVEDSAISSLGDGLHINVATEGVGTTALTNSNITIESGAAVNAKGISVVASGANSSAKVDVIGNSIINMIGGLHGISVASADITINTSNESSIITNQDGGYGIFANGSGPIKIDNKASIATKGKAANGIYAEVQSNVALTTVINSGNITIVGPEASAIRVNSAKEGNITITHKAGATISSTGNTSENGGNKRTDAIFASKGEAGDITLQIDGDVTTTGVNRAGAVYASGGAQGNILINASGNMTTLGTNDTGPGTENKYSYGIAGVIQDRLDSTGDITINYSKTNATNGNVETNSKDSFGLYAGLYNVKTGKAQITNLGGTVTTKGDGSYGIWSRDESNDGGLAYAKNTGSITTLGSSAHGIYANSTHGNVEVINGGILLAGGAIAHGIYTKATTGTSTVILEAMSDIQGGSGVAAGVSMVSITGNQTLKNAGKIGALSDLALHSETTGGSFTTTNKGIITGFTKFIGDSVTFNNEASGILSLRNFSSGVKDTIGSQFGGNGVFNNVGLLELNNLNYDGTATQAILSGVKTFNHSGVISLSSTKSRSGVSYAGDTLAISGNFVSNGGSVYLDTLLDDASSNGGMGTSDRLLLEDTTLGSGATKLFVTSMAGSKGSITQNNGIEVVNVSGSSATGAFALGNDVFSDAYQYQLTQTGNHWYLTNTTGPIDQGTSGTNTDSGLIIYRPDAGVELANRENVVDMMVPGLSGSGAAPNGIGGSGAMRSNVRLGSGDVAGTIQGQKSNSLWSFATANNSRGKAAGGQIRYHGQSKVLQVGGDRIFSVGNSLIQAGIMAHMSTTDSKSRNIITGSITRGESDGYGFGVYATWYAKADDVLSPFIDTYAMFGRFKNTVKTRNNSDYSYRSNAFSLTMVGGYPLSIGENIIIEPQAQLTYVKYSSKKHRDHANTDIKLNTKGNVIGRVGAYVYGQGYNIQPYGALNIWYDDTRSEMRYNIDGGKIGADKRGAIVEAKLGFQTQATKNLTLWGEVSGRKGQNSYRDIGGAIGFKYAW